MSCKQTDSTLRPSAARCFKSLYYEETKYSDATIKCDFDKRNPMSVVRVSRVIERISSFRRDFMVRSLMICTTRKGHHLRMWLNTTRGIPTARSVLRIQSAMGDDPMRQRFNAARVRRGEPHWNVLWNKKIRNGKTVSEEVLDVELTKRLQEVVR